MRVTLTLHHAPVGRVCDGVDVRRHLVPLLALVHVHNLLGVDGQVLVGVDHHAEQPGVRLHTHTALGDMTIYQYRDKIVTKSSVLFKFNSNIHNFLQKKV